MPSLPTSEPRADITSRSQHFLPVNVNLSRSASQATGLQAAAPSLAELAFEMKFPFHPHIVG